MANRLDDIFFRHFRGGSRRETIEPIHRSNSPHKLNDQKTSMGTPSGGQRKTYILEPHLRGEAYTDLVPYAVFPCLTRRVSVRIILLIPLPIFWK